MMPSRIPAALACAGAWLAVCPAPASAQVSFLDAVRDLATMAASADANASGDAAHRSAMLARMTAALAEWDAGISALEGRVAPALRDAPGGRAFQLHVELGLAYRQRGRLDDAQRELDAAAALQPAASDVHVLRALTLDAAGKHAEARAAWRAAWLRDAANPIKAYQALRAAGALDAPERARARQALRDTFDRVLAAREPPAGASFLVLDPVPDALARSPIAGDAALANAFARLAEGRLDAAMRALAEWASTDAAPGGESPRAALERGRAAESQGRYDEARRAYTLALTGTLAGRHGLHVGIGRLAQVDGHLDAAIEAFEHAARLNPNDPLIRRELAGAYAAAGRFDDAFDELVAALTIDPRNAEALTAIGQLFLDTDRVADAVATLRRAVAVEPEKADAHYGLAMALSRAGRADEAARQFERFERLNGEALQQRRRAVTGQAAPPAGR